MDIHQEVHLREIKHEIARVRWWVVFWGRLAAIILGIWVIVFIYYFISGLWVIDFFNRYAP